MLGNYSKKFIIAGRRKSHNPSSLTECGHVFWTCLSPDLFLALVGLESRKFNVHPICDMSEPPIFMYHGVLVQSLRYVQCVPILNPSSSKVFTRFWRQLDVPWCLQHIRNAPWTSNQLVILLDGVHPMFIVEPCPSTTPCPTIFFERGLSAAHAPGNVQWSSVDLYPGMSKNPTVPLPSGCKGDILGAKYLENQLEIYIRVFLERNDYTHPWM